MSLRRLYDVDDVCLLGYFSFKRKQQKILTFSDETFSDVSNRTFSPKWNKYLILIWVCVCVCVCREGEGGNFTPTPRWFSLNNSETVKSATLAFDSIP